MTTIKRIKKTKTLSDFAEFLGYKPKALSFILYKIPLDKKYTVFPILKKSGGERIIKAPIKKLKKLQKRLAYWLQKCYDEIAMESPDDSYTKSLSHGFRTGHSIVTNAKKHRNKRHVFNIDLEDFFPSFNFGRVRGFFIKNRQFELEPDVATVIAQIACHDNELPQGSPCSPVISNLITHLLDIRMVGLAKRSKCTYSRYADDLTFSTNQKKFPKKIAIKETDDVRKWVPGETLVKEIERVGFIINKDKTSMQFKTSRQVTTGLIVNQKINVKREYYKNAKAMCNSLFWTNEFHLAKKSIVDKDEDPSKIADGKDPFGTKKDKKNDKVSGSLNQLWGILNFIYQIKRPYDENTIGERRYKPKNITKLYREFLFYKHFFALKRPLIICEGKTDIVYLKCAIEQLKGKYTDLIGETESDDKYKVGFLKLSNTFLDVLAISAGTPGLKGLMEIYETHMEPFKGDGKKFPVIILVDNDAGTKKINSLIKKTDFTEPFKFFKQNLYVVHIADDDVTKDIAIEDLFTKETLDTKIGEKTFSTKKKINQKNEYSKQVFAQKVIKQNKTKINFDGFTKVLDSFQYVIKDYQKK